MADSLILKGVREVRKHKGTDLLFRYPKGRGTDAQWQLKKWWVNGGVSTQYVKATVFDVTTAGGTVKLALTTSPSSTIRIDFDGTTFTADSFIGVNGVDYAGVFTEDFELIEYYIMPRLAGGAVAKAQFADAADYPGGGPAPTPEPTPEPTPDPTPDPTPEPSPTAFTGRVARRGRKAS